MLQNYKKNLKKHLFLLFLQFKIMEK